MKVALDLEDVLVKNVELFVERLQEFSRQHHGTAEGLNIESIEDWRFIGLRERFAEIRGWEDGIGEKFMTGDQNGWPGFFQVTEEIWSQEGRPELREEASPQVVADLSRRADRLDIVTARKNVDSHVRKRVRNTGLINHVDDVVIERKKHRLDYDVYIDDHVSLHRKLENSAQVMVKQPWNADLRLERPHRKVEKLSQAVEVVNDLD